MNRIIALGASEHNVTGKRQKTVGREIVIGPNAIRFFTIAICAILALVYLTQSTAGANRGFEVSSLEGARVELTLQREQLETEQARLKSINVSNEVAVTAGLLPVTEVEHLGAKPQ